MFHTAGSSESSPPTSGPGSARQFPRPRTLGGQPGAFRRHLPLRPQVAPIFGEVFREAFEPFPRSRFPIPCVSLRRELRPLLVSIWAKILAVDPSCQTDLIRDSSHKYFLSVLQDDQSMAAEHRTTWAAFILATIVHNFPQGRVCLPNQYRQRAFSDGLS